MVSHFTVRIACPSSQAELVDPGPGGVPRRKPDGRMNSDHDRDRRREAALRIFVVNGARMPREHHEPGSVAPIDLLTMQRHVSDPGVGIFDERDSGRNEPARISLGHHRCRQILQIGFLPDQSDFFHGGTRPVVRNGSDRLLEASGNLLQQVAFVDVQADRPLAPVGDDLAARSPTGMSFDVGEQT
jgi:hypothetical protein